MVLEETLVVYDQDDAHKIVGALRKKGIAVRIVRKDILVRSITVTGRFRDFRAALQEEIARAAEDEEIRSWLEKSLASLDQSEEAVSEFLQQNPPGEPISPVVEKERLLELIKSRREGEGGEEDDVGKLFKVRLILDLLEQNGQIELNEDGRAILRGHIDTGDLMTSLPVEMVDEAEPEALRKHGITTSMKIISDPDYLLEFGPEAITELELSDLTELLKDSEYDPDSYDEFCESVQIKRMIATRIIETIGGRGTVAPDEIIHVLQNDVITLADGHLKVGMNLDPDYVKGLLNDMRKVGMIRKKGAGYRVA